MTTSRLPVNVVPTLEAEQFYARALEKNELGVRERDVEGRLINGFRFVPGPSESNSRSTAGSSWAARTDSWNSRPWRRRGGGWRGVLLGRLGQCSMHAWRIRSSRCENTRWARHSSSSTVSPARSVSSSRCSDRRNTVFRESLLAREGRRTFRGETRQRRRKETTTTRSTNLKRFVPFRSSWPNPWPINWPMSNWRRAKRKRKTPVSLNSQVCSPCNTSRRVPSALLGFLNASEISAYQRHAVQANIEEWQHFLVEGTMAFVSPRDSLLRLETFGTYYFPLSSSDAEHFVRIFERHFQSLHDEQKFEEISRRMSSPLDDDPVEQQWLDEINVRLQQTIDAHFSQDEGFFAKTSSRSAKDASLFRKEFLLTYREQLSTCSTPDEENSRLIALLTAAFLCLRVHCASDVLSMLISSERIYQDMLLALDVSRHSSSSSNSFVEHLVLRPFVSIDVDMEFRGFVFEGQLTCLSQYNYLIYSARLVEARELILGQILQFFNETVKNKLQAYSAKSYVIDFAVTQGGQWLSPRKILSLSLSVVCRSDESLGDRVESVSGDDGRRSVQLATRVVSSRRQSVGECSDLSSHWTCASRLVVNASDVRSSMDSSWEELRFFSSFRTQDKRKDFT